MEAVRRQAMITFSRHSTSSFEENLKSLMSAMSLLTREDVGLDCQLMRDSRAAPVTFVNIHEHEDFAVSMFVLRRRSKLPLHDHPLMHGLLKVVSGEVVIRNYSFIEDPARSLTSPEVLVRAETPAVVSESDPPVLLTPTQGNIHEITCEASDGAAFVDVLAPPYGSQVLSLGPRPCFYYFKTPDQPSPNTGTVRFSKSEEHPAFWTDCAPYLGN